ncbi:MAG: chromate transporter [Paludibacteraceae bacterium]|nr:chromate transporter [Paludibacteraceae bacterium]
MFASFFKIGAFTLGGGYAMIPLVRDEVVDRRKWIDSEEFLNMLALAQSAPGVMAVNTAIFVGYKMRGWKGVICTTLGSILPSFVIILLIAAVFTRYKEYPLIEAAFKGIRPAVVALIAAPLIKMAKSAGLMKTDNNPDKKRENAVSWLLLVIPVSTALIIWLLDISPVYIILFTIICALAVTFLKDRKERRTRQ